MRSRLPSLDAFGSFTDAEAVAAAWAVDYVRLTQAGQMPRLSHPSQAGEAGQMEMDAATRASLEIVRARDGGTALSLQASVTRTLGAPGARKLGSWLSAPLMSPAAIAARQDGWGFLIANAAKLAALRTSLRGAPDMARALARLSLNRGGPRDLATIRAGLVSAGEAALALDGPAPGMIEDAARSLRAAPALATLLGQALAEPAPVRLEDGNVIAHNYDGELDAERRLRDDSRRVISSLQLDFCQRYGVASLKIRHHAQLGYVVEAPAAAVESLRAHPDLTLRQGMANGARFTHSDLSALDRRITEAADRAQARERVIFAGLVAAVLAEANAVAGAAEALAVLDALQSCARLAEGGNWCRPEVDDTDAFCITGGRHPVVEGGVGRRRILRSERLRPLAGPSCAAAHRPQHGR